MMPKGYKQARKQFICHRCGGPGDLSAKYHQIRVRMGQPLYCAACRDWAAPSDNEPRHERFSNHREAGGS